MVEVLDGQGNTDPIRVDVEPGSRWRYSGGGYTVAQLLMTDVAGQSFPDLMEQRILGPATPADLARFSIAIWRSYRGEPGGLLSAEMAEEMLREHDNDYGLGFGLFGDGAGRWFGHGGSNEGFRCHTRMYVESGDGVVTMTNGERGIPLIGELIRAVAAEYRWPGSEPEVKTMARLAPHAGPGPAGGPIPGLGAVRGHGRPEGRGPAGHHGAGPGNSGDAARV